MVEEPRKINVGLLVGGGAVIAVSAAAAYYIYSGNVLISDYIDLVDDYERTYREFIADGVLDEHEDAILQVKRERLRILGEKVQDHGLLKQLKEILAQVKGIIVEGGPWMILIIIVYWIAKKYKPPGPHKCPKCGKNFYTDYRLRRHLERDHPVIDTAPAAEVWPLIQQLPQWLIDILGIAGGFSALFAENIKKSWDSIPSEVQIALIIFAIFAIAVVIVMLWGLPAPTLGPIAAGLAICIKP